MSWMPMPSSVAGIVLVSLASSPQVATANGLNIEACGAVFGSQVDDRITSQGKAQSISVFKSFACDGQYETQAAVDASATSKDISANYKDAYRAFMGSYQSDSVRQEASFSEKRRDFCSKSSTYLANSSAYEETSSLINSAAISGRLECVRILAQARGVSAIATPSSGLETFTVDFQLRTDFPRDKIVIKTVAPEAKVTCKYQGEDVSPNFAIEKDYFFTLTCQKTASETVVVLIDTDSGPTVSMRVPGTAEFVTPTLEQRFAEVSRRLEATLQRLTSLENSVRQGRSVLEGGQERLAARVESLEHRKSFLVRKRHSDNFTINGRKEEDRLTANCPEGNYTAVAAGWYRASRSSSVVVPIKNGPVDGTSQRYEIRFRNHSSDASTDEILDTYILCLLNVERLGW